MTVEFIGPFQEHRVTVGGRRVPYLTAEPCDDGGWNLTLDRRFGLTLDGATPDQIVAFVAHAIAVGMGYACMPSGDSEAVRANPFPMMMSIGSVETDGVRPLRAVPPEGSA